MPELTEQEFQEYLNLRSLYSREKMLESVRSVRCLRDDIDQPIRNCVAYLALLGCNPVWSCCGFDYIGQPIHKSHEYGSSGFCLTDNEQTRRLSESLETADMPYQKYMNKWKI